MHDLPLQSFTRTVAPFASLAMALLTACTGAGEPGTGAVDGGNGGGDGGSNAGPGSGGRGDGGEDTSGPVSASSGGEGGAGAATASVSSAATTVAASSSAMSSTGTGVPDQVAEVFAHSADTLYRIDLDTNQVQTIGSFSGCNGSVIDIALDKDSQMYGTTFEGLYRIDRTTADCSFIANGSFPNSLSFVPAGTLDPVQERLVGYLGANYVRIDTTTGAVVTIGSNALNNGLESSGDIVSVIDGPTLLTVKGTGCEDLDCVVAIDPSTGEALGNLGSAGYNDVFGVAFWAGSLYGFTRAGELFEFVQDDDGGITTTPIQVSSGLEFYGAGSTTAAPPTDIPN